MMLLLLELGQDREICKLTIAVSSCLYGTVESAGSCLCCPPISGSWVTSDLKQGLGSFEGLQFISLSSEVEVVVSDMLFIMCRCK